MVNYLKLADDLWSAGDREAAASIWEDKVLGLGCGDLYASWRLFQYCTDDDERREYYRQEATRLPGLCPEAVAPSGQLTRNACVFMLPPY